MIEKTDIKEYEKYIASVYTEEGSDKMGLKHDYAPVYARIFRDLKTRNHVKIAEIGVLSGSSLRAMLRLFDNAEIFGIDKDEVSVDGTTVVIGDGYSASTWDKLPNDLDLVIDDGSHSIVDMIRGLYVIFEHLKPGGRVLIEDITDQGAVDTLLSVFPGGEFIDSTATGAGDDRIVVWTKGADGAAVANKVQDKTCVLFNSHIVNGETVRRFDSLRSGAESLGMDVVWVVDNSNPDAVDRIPASVCKFPVGPDSLSAFPKMLFKSNIHGGSLMWTNCTTFGVVPFKAAHKEYDYVWHIEFDVCYSGRWDRFLSHFTRSGADLITSNVMAYKDDPHWMWWADIGHAAAARHDLHRSLNPILRVSRREFDAAVRFADRFGTDNAIHTEMLFAGAAFMYGLDVIDVAKEYHGLFTFAKLNVADIGRLVPDKLYHGIPDSVDFSKLLTQEAL